MAHADIPPFDLREEVDSLWEELNAALQRVLRSGRFVMGPEVEALEQELAAYLGVGHAVALGSGTDALVIGLEALGVGPGDGVITTPFSFFATAEAISRVGATPVFVDIAEASFNLDPDGLEAALSPLVKAIVPVHLFGLPADMARIMAFAEAHDLVVLEDCAQAFGAKVGDEFAGAIGHAGAFSFYPTKNLGAYGEGGLLSTNDAEVARVARLLRNHGSARRYDHERLGYNSRLDELQAAILRVKLPHVAAWNRRRHVAAERYDRLLAGLPGVSRPPLEPAHVFHQYTIRLPAERRDAVQAHLAARHIGSTVHYPVPQHRAPVYQNRFPAMPVSERLAREVLSLPLWPGISAADQQRVAAAIAQALE